MKNKNTLFLIFRLKKDASMMFNPVLSFLILSSVLCCYGKPFIGGELGIYEEAQGKVNGSWKCKADLQGWPNKTIPCDIRHKTVQSLSFSNGFGPLKTSSGGGLRFLGGTVLGWRFLCICGKLFDVPCYGTCVPYRTVQCALYYLRYYACIIILVWYLTPQTAFVVLVQ